ncbi:hypothetical protein GOP47_0030795 [Adiantum capillus-veneris]|nr:hypothetical protein GOP47_0030795 [Adiantum capillus-veneris]
MEERAPLERGHSPFLVPRIFLVSLACEAALLFLALLSLGTQGMTWPLRAHDGPLPHHHAIAESTAIDNGSIRHLLQQNHQVPPHVNIMSIRHNHNNAVRTLGTMVNSLWSSTPTPRHISARLPCAYVLYQVNLVLIMWD